MLNDKTNTCLFQINKNICKYRYSRFIHKRILMNIQGEIMNAIISSSLMDKDVLMTDVYKEIALSLRLAQKIRQMSCEEKIVFSLKDVEELLFKDIKTINEIYSQIIQLQILNKNILKSKYKLHVDVFQDLIKEI